MLLEMRARKQRDDPPQTVNLSLVISVLERPTSQMSYLEHFLKETAGNARHSSVDSVEGDIEDNRAPSITSSKSNLSELSIVSIVSRGLISYYLLLFSFCYPLTRAGPAYAEIKVKLLFLSAFLGRLAWAILAPERGLWKE
jgi:hypothetical protein